MFDNYHQIMTKFLLQGEHNHSNQLLHQRVKTFEDEAVQNAAKNLVIPPRAILGDLAVKLQGDSVGAASTMSKKSTLQKRIYRARYITFLNIKAFL